MLVYKKNKPYNDENILISYTKYIDSHGNISTYKYEKFKQPNTDMTFEDLYIKYYNYQKDKIKLTTQKTYIDRIKYLNFFNKIKLYNFNISDYENWKNIMNKYNLSNSYKNMILKLLKAILNFGTKWYDFDFSNVYNKITNFNDPNEIKKEMLYYTYDEFKKYISVEKDLKYKCLFEILYYCGLRKGELKALTWNNIDFNNQFIYIRKNIISNYIKGNKYIITTPKTLKSIRDIPIPKQLINDLKEYKESINNFKEDNYVFGNDKPINNASIRKRNIKNAKLANLKIIRIHDFRHSCASLLINNNANITLVARYLGHSKIDITLNTYSHMFKSSLNNIVNIINELDKNNKTS